MRRLLLVVLLVCGCKKEDWCARVVEVRNNATCERECLLASMSARYQWSAEQDCRVRLCGGQWVCQ